MGVKHQEVYDRIIDNIKRYRKREQLSQKRLAERAQISKGYLSQIEAKNCNKFCSIDTLINIAEALDIKLFELFLFE